MEKNINQLLILIQEMKILKNKGLIIIHRNRKYDALRRKLGGDTLM